MSNSKVKEIGAAGYTIPVLLQEVMEAAEADKLVHGVFISIDPKGGVRVWQTGMSLAQATYLEKMHSIFIHEQLIGER
jgi:hypothetical protein